MNNEPRNSIVTRKRIVFVLLVIFLVQAVIVGRYAWVQISWSGELQKLATEQWTSDTRIEAKRGSILDRNGNYLAVSGNVQRVDVFMKDVLTAQKKNPDIKQEMAEKLSETLGMSYDTVLAKLNKTLSNGQPINSVSIARRIEKSIGNAIREMDLPGVVISEDTKRYYPNGTLLSHVLGTINSDGDGRSGIELEYNEELKGIEGRSLGETDNYNREQASSLDNYIAPVDGNDVVLTIDMSIQYFVEKAIEKGLVDFKAKEITCIVMNPKTGEILAMANAPGYDLNNPVPGSVEEALQSWKNNAVSKNFEPGSIFKVITSAAALEEGKVKLDDTFACGGSYKVADTIIHCWKRTGHGTQVFPQILQNSCNVGFMMVGERLGKETLYKYYDAFGFGQKTNIDLPGEEKGILQDMKNVGPVELANLSFGQGISVTAIQYLTALSAIANDGVMVQPHIVKAITSTDDEGNRTIIKEFDTTNKKQVISKETSEQLRNILESVVQVGGAKKAYIKGYHIGGKTGTAQKVINGAYQFGRYISSFASITPCNDPQFAVLVAIDEPDPSNYYSGSTSVPLTKEILQDIFNYMNVQPDLSDDEKESIVEVVIPEVRGCSVEEAKKMLKNASLDCKTEGTGSVVYDISPKPGISVAENTKITLYLGSGASSDGTVAVPDFTGMTQKEIQNAAGSVGLKVAFSGTGIGASQDIKAGKMVNKNTVVNIILQDTDE